MLNENVMPMGMEEEVGMVEGEDLQGEEVGSEAEEHMQIFIAQGLKLIHNQGATEQLLTQVKNHTNKPVAIGQITEHITEKLEQEGNRNGIEFDPSAVLAGSIKLMEELVFISQELGYIEEFTEEDAKIAIGQFVGQYLEGALGRGDMTQEQLVALGASVASDPANVIQDWPTGGGEEVANELLG